MWSKLQFDKYIVAHPDEMTEQGLKGHIAVCLEFRMSQHSG